MCLFLLIMTITTEIINVLFILKGKHSKFTSSISLDYDKADINIVKTKTAE